MCKPTAEGITNFSARRAPVRNASGPELRLLSGSVFVRLRFSDPDGVRP